MNEKMKQSFCILPWIHSFVNLSGAYQVCCTSEEFDNNIIGNDGKKMNIKDNVNIDQVMNSNYMKALRVKMMNGEWDFICSRCKITEMNDGHSRRLIDNKKYEHLIEDVIASTKADGTIHNRITSADYRLGNLCNLQCRMCNPKSTYLWIREWNEIKPPRERYSQDRIEGFKNYDWIHSRQLITDFKSKVNKLNHLHFAGGEPLIVPQMKRILEICIEEGASKNIILTYNTNITKIPSPVVELWKEFREVCLLVSIDAVGELNSYIRYPSKWSIIDRNMKILDEQYKEMNVSEVLVSTTVQALNILHLDQLYKYLDQFKFIKKAPNLINLHVPVYFQSTYLPEKLKNQATKRLLKIIPRLKSKIFSSDQYLIDNIFQVIKFMHSYDNAHDFSTLLNFQDEFDRKRGVSLFDVLPELKEYDTRSVTTLTSRKNPDEGKVTASPVEGRHREGQLPRPEGYPQNVG